MILLLALTFYQAKPCTYVDVHGIIQPCSAKHLCPPGQHMHSKSDSFTVQQNTWTVGKKVPGDGLCHDNSTDKAVNSK